MGEEVKLKPHPEHPDIFAAADGRVFRELLPSVDAAGYHQIRNGKYRDRRHVLVAEVFHGPRPPGCVVRHKNGVPGDDAETNLEWGTPMQNVHDSMVAGAFPKGSKAGPSKLSEWQVKEIALRRDAGEEGRKLAVEFGVSESSICDIVNGRTWGWLTGKGKIA